jgi:hypothetical protein
MVSEAAPQLWTSPSPVLFEFYFGFSVGVNCSQLVRGNGSSSNGIISVDGGGASSCCCSSSGSSNNANSSNSQWTKLEASIKAVPRDRTLLETDRATFGEDVAGDLCRMCEVIAAASGGTLAASDVARVTAANTARFLRAPASQ